MQSWAMTGSVLDGSDKDILLAPSVPGIPLPLFSRKVGSNKDLAVDLVCTLSVDNVQNVMMRPASSRLSSGAFYYMEPVKRG
jgi:hypothetical protein